MKHEFRIDRGEFRADAERTPEGAIKGVARITRTGVFPYTAADGSTMWELRHPNEVFSKATLDSARDLPVQVEHVAMLNADNMAQLKSGHGGSDVKVDAPFVEVPVTIDTKRGTSYYDAGNREFSCGYYTNVIPEAGVYDGKPYTHRQTDIRYNHVAQCGEARLGPEMSFKGDAGSRMDSSVRIAYRNDSATPEQESDMNMVKINLDGGLSYDAAPEVKVYIDGLLRKLSDAAAAAATLKTETDAKMSKLESERDTANTSLVDEKKAHTELKDSFDASVTTAAVDRAELRRVAELCLDTDVFAKFETMKADEVRKAVVSAKLPNLKLDGKDAVYIQTSFDSIVAGLDETATGDGAPGNTGAAIRQAVHGDGAKPAPAAKSLEQKQDAYNKARLDAHKKKSAVAA